MALTSGTRLGPYEIQSPLGAGGMGEVYRARDTRLERTVAIKVLNAQLVASSELRARFEREAKIVSQLQHPHICVLHDVGNEGPIDFLVMEFLQGESLAERLRKGPLPPEQVLTIAIEIADALEKAHRAGVVHRDLKPGNVMLTKSGAKLLDFGLAKPLGATVASGSGGSGSASVFAAALTQTMPSPSPASPLSTAGAVIGTVQYMSPEQIQGIEADARSDIFSFGVMLFEMVTGKRTFEAKTQAGIVGQILAVDPPSVSTLRPQTPPGLDRVIRLCLDKDPDERIQTAHDLKLQLQAIVETPAAATQAPVVVPVAARRSWLPWIAVGVLAVAVIGFALAYMQSLRTPQVSVHSYILPPEKATFNLIGTAPGPPALSPDGLRLAFVAKGADGKQMLWIRPLNSAVAQAMSGSEGASNPFWSADSRYVAFFASSKLNKVDAGGGPPQALCDATGGGRGGAWNSTGTIIFSASSVSALSRVDAAGGTPVSLTTLDAKVNSHRWPQFLPDGNHYLYFAHGAMNADSAIYLAALDSKERKLLLRNDSGAIYAPGYLLFVRDNTLMAQGFNLRSLALEGEAKPLADHVAVNTDVWRGIITASAKGELLYQHGDASGGSQLIWYDASGKAGEPVLPDTAQYYWPSLSPDGSKLAVSLENNGLADIWMVDLVRHTKTRITFGPLYSTGPVWWPDGKSIVYSYGPAGATDSIYRQNADGTGSKEKLLETPGIRAMPFSVSPDGRYIGYMKNEPKSNTGWDIWALPMFGDKSGDGKPFSVVSTNFTDVVPVFSPDGKWLVYSNNETGRYEVYIQPFPNGAGRWQVSTAGGSNAVWRKDVKELFFQSLDQQIMAVDVHENGASLELGAPHALFKAATVNNGNGPYTVSADGKKFVMNTVLPQSITEPLTLVTNWTADLKP
jgi:eukaryotic-like serine/threonine-protein kinase